MSNDTIDIDAVKVSSVMSKDVVSISKKTTIREIKEFFLKNNFTTLPIVENNQVIGVVAAFDFLKIFDIADKFSYDLVKDKPICEVEEVCRKGVITVAPEDSLRRCIEYMSSFRMRYLPVVDKKRKLLGIISVDDIVSYLMK